MLDLRVMSFNILAESYDRGYPAGDPRHWPTRLPLNLSAIRRGNPDVLGVQEMGLVNLADYQRELADYDYWLGLTATPYRHLITPMRNFFNEWWPAIFWKRDRFDLVNAGGFYISRTLDASHWYVSHVFDPHYMHPITWVRLRAKTGTTSEGAPIEFLAFNTHMHHLARTDGNRPFVEHMLKISGGNLPVLLTGDFNNTPWLPDKGWTDTAHRAFLEGGFIDTYRAAGGADTDEDYTYHAYYGRSIPPGSVEDPWRMDWVLVHPGRAQVTVRSHTILRDEEPPVYPSDHYPVVGELTLG